MNPRKAALVLFVLLASALAASAETLTAYPLDGGPVLLFERPERGAKGAEVTLPEDGTALTDERRTGDDRWYAATVGGKKGWLFGGALYVSGPASEEDTEKTGALYTRYTGAAEALFEGMGPDENWVRRPNVRYEGDEDNSPGTIVTWASREAVIQSMSTDSNVLQLHFAANTPAAAEHFLGFPAVGMTEEQLVRRLSPETGRRGKTLIWSMGGGEVTFEFTVEDGKVTQVEYNAFPGNGAILPERAFELRRFRDAPGDGWPRPGWSKGTHVRVRALPSTQAKVVEQLKEEETGFVWRAQRDRGEAHPWYSVELTSGGNVRKGWIYGQFVTRQEEPEDNTYWAYFRDRAQHDLWENMDAVTKPLGKPRQPDAWTREWPGLRLQYQEFEDGETRERYLAAVAVSDPKIDIGGIRVGDPAESLTELVQALLRNGWDGAKELKEGENVFNDSEGLNSFTLVIEEDRLASFEWHYNAS